MSQKQTILTVIALLVILVLVMVFTKSKDGNNEQVEDTAAVEEVQADIYSQRAKVTSIGDSSLVVEFAVPVVNSEGIAEPRFETRELTIDDNTEIIRRGSEVEISALEVDQNVVVFTNAKLANHNNQHAVRIDIQ